MASRLTFKRAQELRKDALELFREAKSSGDFPSAESQRKRIESLDEYLATTYRPDGVRRGNDAPPASTIMVKTTVEDNDGPEVQR